MDGLRLGRLSLRLDAAYCAVVAVCLALFAVPLSGALGLPDGAVLAAAAGAAVWALALHLAAHGTRLQPALVVVLVANTAGALGIAALAVTRPVDALSLLLGGVALEVAAFAVSQAVALRRPA